MRPYPAPRYLVDDAHEDYIADLPGGVVGAVAVAEQLSSIIHNEEMKGADHLDAMLRKAKHLSASKGGRGRDDLVEVNRTRADARLPPEYGQHPAMPAEVRS